MRNPCKAVRLQPTELTPLRNSLSPQETKRRENAMSNRQTGEAISSEAMWYGPALRLLRADLADAHERIGWG